MILFNFRGEDSGNCRVYYQGERNGKRFLYCIQNDGSRGRDNYVFYSCSRDGEPSSPLRMPLDTSFDRKIMPQSIERVQP